MLVTLCFTSFPATEEQTFGPASRSFETVRQSQFTFCISVHDRDYFTSINLFTAVYCQINPASGAHCIFATCFGSWGTPPSTKVTLANDQLDAQIFNIFITILYMYMFRAISCSSSGGQIVLIQYLVSSISVSDRPVHRLRKNCKFFLNLCTGGSLTETDNTKCCINTIWPP